jgi:lipoprotein-anchoring transpeptidase ErfK/SrfK
MGKDEAANAYGNGVGGGPGDSDSGAFGRAIVVRGRRVRVITIALAAVGVLLIGVVVAAFAYDSAHKDQIADGVKVGSVDVGGLNRDQAAHRIRRHLVTPLHRPIKVNLGSDRFNLPARRLKVRADVEGMVGDAIDTSQSWGLPARLVRYVSGGSVDHTVQPEISYSTAAVHRFVHQVAKRINRPPQDATVSPTGSSLNVVPAENGRTLKQGKLAKGIRKTVNRGGRNRLIAAHIVVTKPKISTDEVASKYPVYLTLDRAGFTLRLWKQLKLVKSYPVAVGQLGLETPAGLYHIQNKEVDPVWHVPNSAWAGSLAGQDIPPGPEDPLKARWLGIFSGAGIHGTDETWSIGEAVSHGCVRMTIPDVIDLYPQVPVGTPIYIG